MPARFPFREQRLTQGCIAPRGFPAGVSRQKGNAAGTVEFAYFFRPSGIQTNGCLYLRDFASNRVSFFLNGHKKMRQELVLPHLEW